jgi:hypothetical protein
VRSLLKSVSGLQARKLQELALPSFSAESHDAFELRSSAGLRAGLLSLLRGRRLPGGSRLQLGHDAAAGAAAGGSEYAGSVGAMEGDGGGGGGDGGDGETIGGGGSGDPLLAGDCLELMRDALRAKHKARKVALLLGTPPPLPPRPLRPTGPTAEVVTALG